MTQESDLDSATRLYTDWIDAWNRRDAAGMAALVAPNGNVVGFDGSQLDGPATIASTIGEIFRQHQTPPYITTIQEVRVLAPGVVLVRAVAGMIPPGISEIDPGLHSIQSLIAVEREGAWRIELFQNTPAAFHGRPDLIEAITKEIRRAAEQA